MKDRSIIHIDMDAFYAAIESRDNPYLRGKPVIIGALPSERGVVSTCSYEARRYGVRSAMNIKEAYRRCPDGIYMHGDMRKYARVSAQIHDIMYKYTDKIEFVASDEGYMDVTESVSLFGGAEEIGRALKREIAEKLKLTCSVGISYCKMAAKLASEEKKPNGFFVIPDKEALLNLIRQRPLGIINGIGKKTEERFNYIGIYTVGDLLNSPREIIEPFGAVGAEILKLASGNDDREVVSESEIKSIGREHTFQENVTDFLVLDDALVLLARDVSMRLKRQGRWARTVTLKIKFSDMKCITRSRSAEPINSAKAIYCVVHDLLRNEQIKKAVRLIGVSLGNLQESFESGSEQLSLFDEIEPEKFERRKKAQALDDAVYSMDIQFGKGTLKTARELGIMKKIYSDE